MEERGRLTPGPLPLLMAEKKGAGGNRGEATSTIRALKTSKPETDTANWYEMLSTVTGRAVLLSVRFCSQSSAD